MCSARIKHSVDMWKADKLSSMEANLHSYRSSNVDTEGIKVNNQVVFDIIKKMAKGMFYENMTTIMSYFKNYVKTEGNILVRHNSVIEGEPEMTTIDNKEVVQLTIDGELQYAILVNEKEDEGGELLNDAGDRRCESEMHD